MRNLQIRELLGGGKHLDRAYLERRRGRTISLLPSFYRPHCGHKKEKLRMKSPSSATKQKRREITEMLLSLR